MRSLSPSQAASETTGRTASRTPARRWLPAALLLLGVGLAALPAGAQFNGQPTVNIGPELNRPTLVTTDRALLYPTGHEQVLAPGDALDVQVFGQPEYVPRGRIAADGAVSLPLIGAVKLAGLDVSQAEQAIQDRLRQAGIYRNPQVILTVTEGPNTAVTFIGEMHGVVPVIGSRRLLDVLSAAGGLPATASHILTINRPGVPEPLVIDLGSDPLRSGLADVPVFPGDTIVVARIGVVYMVGQFKTPSVISLTPYSPLTLMQATAMTGGLQFDARLSDVRIIRTVGDRRTVVKLDANQVFKGRAPDPILQPNDIVYVPQSGLKVAIEQGGIGTLLGAVSLAITTITIARQ